MKKNHPPEIIVIHLPNTFSQKLHKDKDLENFFLTWTFNPNHVINLNKFTRILKNIRSNILKQWFQNKSVQIATRQPKNLRKILTKVKFEETPLPLPVKEVGFFPVVIVFITDKDVSSRVKSFQFKVNDKSMI